MYVYNEGRNHAEVMKNPNGSGWVVYVSNRHTGEGMILSNPIESAADADRFAQQFAGYPKRQPVDHDAYEQYLSERLGF